MCNIPQLANESDLQFIIKVTGGTQLETKKCGACDIPMVRPVVIDDISDAEHVGLYHYYQWSFCEQCRRREEDNLRREYSRHLTAHKYLGDKDCDSGNCGRARSFMERIEGRLAPHVYRV